MHQLPFVTNNAGVLLKYASTVPLMDFFVPSMHGGKGLEELSEKNITLLSHITMTHGSAGPKGIRWYLSKFQYDRFKI